MYEPFAVEEVTLVIVGATGPVSVIAVEGDETAEVPNAFVAVLLKVYDAPFGSPNTSQEVLGTVTVQVLAGLIAVGPVLSKAVTV